MPPTILAIETSTDSCSVALLGPNLDLEKKLDAGRRHAESLLVLVDGLLKEARVPRGQIEAVAVSAGPGSYTGLRIGVSAAKGLTEGLGVPLLAVPSLFAAAMASGTPGAHLVVAFPSRRGHVYAAAFDQDKGTLIPRSGPVGGPADEVLGDLLPPNGQTWVVGPAVDRFSARSGVVFRATEARAASVARLGLELLAEGQVVASHLFEPYYLNDVVASVPSGTAFTRLAIQT